MTGLHIHRSQRIEALAEALAERIEAERTSDPFIPSEVAVGSGGMERWLERALALRWGVAANVHFSRPTMLFEEALAELEGERSEGQRFWPASLRFTVLGLMNELVAEVPEASDLAKFVSSEAPLGKAAISMARALADAVDRLIHYRPELVTAGLSGERSRSLADDPALPLMRALFERLEANLGAAHLATRVCRAGERAGAATERALPPLHVFGVSFLPPLYFTLLELLARERPVHVYALVPSEEYYADVADARERTRRELEGTLDVDLPILAGWGKMSREFIHLLYSRVEHFAGDEPRFEEPGASSLLDHAKRDLLKLAPAPTGGLELDESLEVHACFGPLRQVEALRERLLAAFASDPTLRPWEVAVLTPDVATYGPLILSVFAAPEEGLPEIPVEIADVSLVQRAPAADFLMRLLRFAAGRPTVTALAELLEHRAAAERFGLSADDLPLVRELLEASAMRYGADDEPSAGAADDVPVSSIHTLRAGLRRVALGALLPDGAEPYRGFSPVPGLDGENLRVALSLVEATDLYLERRAELRAGARDVGAWVDLLLAVLTDIFGEVESAGRAEVARALGTLRHDAAGLSQALDLGAIVSEVGDRLEELGERMHAQRGGVVVSRLSPMRAVPYRVVALLGLDDGVFPRREKQPSFDLVAKAREVGDRDASIESRHLLLEALLAARERLLVFFTGRDAGTLEAVPPPAALEDLLATMSKMTGTPREPEDARRAKAPPVVVEHPLQPFGNFRPGVHPAARSHSRAMALAATSTLGDRRLPSGPFPPGVQLEPEGAEVIELDELIRFFKDPQKALLGRELRARFPEEAATLLEREPLERDNLEEWALRDELLTAALSGEGADRAAIEARLAGEGAALAHGLQELELDGLERSVEDLVGRMAEKGLAPSLERAEVEVELTFEGDRGALVRGEVPLPIEGKLVLPSASKSVSAHRLLRGMIEAACLASAREPIDVEAVHFVVANPKKDVTRSLPADPRAWLADLVEIFSRGRRRAIPFFPKASRKLAETDDDFEAARKASSEYRGGFDASYAEADSPAARVLFAHDPFFDWDTGEPNGEAVELARKVFGPLSEKRRKESR